MMKKKAAPLLAAAALLAVVAGIGLLTNLVRKYTPTSEVMSGQEYYHLLGEDEAALIVDCRVLEQKGRIYEEVCYADYEAVKSILNDHFYWDADNNTMIFTTPTDIIEIPAGGSSYTADGQTKNLPFNIVMADGDKTFVALDFVKLYTDISYEMFHDPDRIVIYHEIKERTVADIRKKGKVRVLGGIKSPILREVEKNEVVTVLEPMEDWTGVMTQDGYIGYIRNERLTRERTEGRDVTYVPAEYTSLHKNEKVNMVWHQTTSMDSNYSLLYDIAEVKGVNTISPTWFTIAANDGTLDSLALADYVQTAHSSDLEVWALVDNFSTEIDFTKIMNTTSSRMKIENQLIASAIENGFDGINIDFENIPVEASEGYKQFMRELSVKCRKNDLVLSVDIPVPMPYTEHYSWEALGEVCDYVIIMGYDEHYYGSEAGSVASIGFENDGILKTKQYVPDDKIISGIPFYTRLWSTVINADGTEEVTSEAMGMNEAAQILENNNVKAAWDEKTAQNYAEFDGDDGTLYQIWLEDLDSLKEKLTLVKDYDLAGVAAWKLGFEDDAVWDLISKYVH